MALLKQTFDLEPYGNLEKVDAGALDRATAGIQAAKAAKIAKAKAEAEAKAAPQRPPRKVRLRRRPRPAEAAAGEEGAAGDEATAVAPAAVSAFDPSAAVAAATAEAEESAAREAELTAAEVPRLTNAFCVSVFCMDESFESRSSDFLHAAFAAFPEREYAVLTLPHTIAEFSLVNSFSQVQQDRRLDRQPFYRSTPPPPAGDLARRQPGARAASCPPRAPSLALIAVPALARPHRLARALAPRVHRSRRCRARRLATSCTPSTATRSVAPSPSPCVART